VRRGADAERYGLQEDYYYYYIIIIIIILIALSLTDLCAPSSSHLLGCLVPGQLLLQARCSLALLRACTVCLFTQQQPWPPHLVCVLVTQT
jgi:hypothetical protein